MGFHKRFLWIIVFWFALLQTVAPFIHAHTEADSPAQRHGLHIHDQDLLQMSDGQHAFKTISAPPVHTIGVHEVVVKNLDVLPLPIFALLFIISFLVVIIPLASLNQAKYPLPQLYLRSLSRPRAPPLF